MQRIRITRLIKCAVALASLSEINHDPSIDEVDHDNHRNARFIDSLGIYHDVLESRSLFQESLSSEDLGCLEAGRLAR